MSTLVERISRIYDEGHDKELEDLLTDKQFADPNPRPAAVLIALTDRPQPGVILTQRPESMEKHPGQVAFPGGKLEPGEDAVQAALRETHEELAIDPVQVEIIGTSDIYHTGTGFSVTPVLGVIPPDLPIRPDPREVASHFEVPLTHLFNPGNYAEHKAIWQGAERTYYRMEYDGYIIWGVTAAIILNLARRMTLTELFDG